MLMIYQKLSMKTLNKEHLQILSIFLNIFNNNWLDNKEHDNSVNDFPITHNAYVGI